MHTKAIADADCAAAVRHLGSVSLDTRGILILVWCDGGEPPFDGELPL